MIIKLDKGMIVKFKNKNDYFIALDIAEQRLRHETIVKGFRRNTTTIINSYENDDYKKEIVIPRGSGDVLREIISVLKIKPEIIDNTCKGHKISLQHKFNPRDTLQVNAINSFVNNSKKNLILRASCGFGKSFCALKIIENLSISTLILVDENLLLDQWIENITNDCVFDLSKLGIIGKGKEDYIDKDVIIASKDTLINRPEIIDYLNEHIGFVIVDEAHVASADIFQNVLKKLKPYRVLGLTATPKRSDGLSYLMHEQIGPICFKAEREKLIELGSIMNPELRPIYVCREDYFKELFKKEKEKKKEEMLKIQPDETGKYKIGNRKYTEKTFLNKIKAIDSMDMDWQFLSNAVENDMSSIREISKIIKHHYMVGDQSICICRKIEFAKKYIETLKFMGVNPNEIALILGETSSKERKELIEKAKKRELKIIITSSILDKGISIDSANVLFLLYPSKNENSTEQRIGRISRTYYGKTYAYVYDFIYDHGMFFSQFFKSQKVEYKECRWNVERYCTTYNKDKIKNFMEYLMDHFYFKTDTVNFKKESINTNFITEKELSKNILYIK